MIRKLRIKFVIINMSLVTVMLAAIMGLVFYVTGNSIERQNLDMMQRTSNTMSLPAPSDSVPSGEMSDSVPSGEKFGPVPPREMRGDRGQPFFVLDVSGDDVEIIGDASALDLTDKDELDDLVNEVDAREETSGVLKEYNLRFFKTTFDGQERIVFSDVSAELKAMENLRTTCVKIGIVAFLIFLVISILLSRWAVKPVETAWNDQKRFVADASHELKTPLAVITAYADLAAGNECEDGQRQEFAQNIQTSAGQMRSLVENLLLLARGEDDKAYENTEVFDYSDMINSIAMTYEPLFFENNLGFSYEVEEKIMVDGCVERLQHVASILLDNAIKYSTENGEVCLSLKKLADGNCELRVSNVGVAMSQEELKNIFKRFYRGDKSRSRDGSFGLGLPIAESIVSKSGGTIRAESQDGRNTFIVTLKTR